MVGKPSNFRRKIVVSIFVFLMVYNSLSLADMSFHSLTKGFLPSMFRKHVDDMSLVEYL